MSQQYDQPWQQDLKMAADEIARLRSEIAQVGAQRDSYCTQLSEEIGKTCQLEVEIALRDRALEWCLQKGVWRGQCGFYDYHSDEIQVPAEFAAIIGGKS